MRIAIISLHNGSGKRSKVREKSVKSQGIRKLILSGNPESRHGVNVFFKRMKLMGQGSALEILIYCLNYQGGGAFDYLRHV